MPATKPTNTLPRFCILHGTLKATKPMSATGILFKDPTKLYVVAVVVDRNQSDAKLMKNASKALAQAAVMK